MPSCLVATPTLSPVPVQASWAALIDHLTEWFYRPDIEALECALSALAAHYVVDSDPVWMFILGVSGSGKTSMVIEACSAAPNTYVESDLTSKTFISHYRGQPGESLLHEIGSSGILLFKDFTTIMSKRDDERTEIAAQLREIYDGRYRRRSGTGSKGSEWQGKITVLAAATPALERAWAIKRDLGERFVTIRWPRIGGSEMARYAAKQRGHEKEIKATIHKHTSQLFSQLKRDQKLQPLPPSLAHQIGNLAELVAILRGHVVRDSSGTRSIIDIPTIEEPTRLSKAFEALATAHAALFNHPVSESDLRISKRVALDTIPSARRLLFSCFQTATSLTQGEIAKFTSMPWTTVHWIAEELSSLGLLTTLQLGTGNEYELTSLGKSLIVTSKVF